MAPGHLPGSVSTCVTFLSFLNLSLSLRSRLVSARSRCVSRTSAPRSSDCDEAPRASASLTAPRSRLALFSLDRVLARFARFSWLSSWAGFRVRGLPEYCSFFSKRHCAFPTRALVHIRCTFDALPRRKSSTRVVLEPGLPSWTTRSHALNAPGLCPR